nr:hypothetical protein Iba_chr05bCG4190 [Ipomoea batatas]
MLKEKEIYVRALTLQQHWRELKKILLFQIPDSLIPQLYLHQIAFLNSQSIHVKKSWEEIADSSKDLKPIKELFKR